MSAAYLELTLSLVYIKISINYYDKERKNGNIPLTTTPSYIPTTNVQRHFQNDLRKAVYFFLLSRILKLDYILYNTT